MPSPSDLEPRVHLAVDATLGPSQVAVQAAHVVAVAAAHHPHPDRWARTTIVLHTADPELLGALCRTRTAHGGATGADSGVVWFVEPDLLWTPTALCVTDPDDTLTPTVATLDLYDPTVPTATARWAPTALRTLARACARARVDGPELWAACVDIGADPWRIDDRVQVAAALTGHRIPTGAP